MLLNKCLHPYNSPSWKADSRSDKEMSEDDKVKTTEDNLLIKKTIRSASPAPNLGNNCKSEENVHDSPMFLRNKDVQKIPTLSSKRKYQKKKKNNSEKSLQEITNFFEYKSRENIPENETKIVAEKSSKFTKNKLSIQEITQFFEKKVSESGVSKVGGGGQV